MKVSTILSAAVQLFAFCLVSGFTPLFKQSSSFTSRRQTYSYRRLAFPSYSFARSLEKRYARFDRTIGIVKYEPSNDPPSINFSDNSGIWSALVITEKWITKTLEESGQSSTPNPYTRKEISYICEMSQVSCLKKGCLLVMLHTCILR